MRLISDNVDTLTGMRITGVAGVVAHTREEFRAAMDDAVGDADVAVVIVTELLAKSYPDIADEVKLGRSMPLLVEVPDRHGTGRPPDFITAYVRDAIGLRI